MTGLEPADWEPQLRAVADAFRERLDMLEESGQVTALARWMTESTLARISKVFDLTLDEDNAAQFTTHVAMAFSRLQRGEAEAPLSPELAAEVAEHPR
ncbi:MAG: hypothetical protein QOE60_1839, partial [Thermoleophilaceae bacterium]|nr:hypothetical protein [Thermoleophilaceae bacterium]